MVSCIGKQSVLPAATQATARQAVGRTLSAADTTASKPAAVANPAVTSAMDTGSASPDQLWGQLKTILETIMQMLQAFLGGAVESGGKESGNALAETQKPAESEDAGASTKASKGSEEPGSAEKLGQAVGGVASDVAKAAADKAKSSLGKFGSLDAGAQHFGEASGEGFNGAGWCHQFVISAIQDALGKQDISPQVLYNGKVPEKSGKNYTPKVGDVVQFHGQLGRAGQHVALVTNVILDAAGQIEAIEICEGNFNNSEPVHKDTIPWEKAKNLGFQDVIGQYS